MRIVAILMLLVLSSLRGATVNEYWSWTNPDHEAIAHSVLTGSEQSHAHGILGRWSRASRTGGQIQDDRSEPSTPRNLPASLTAILGWEHAQTVLLRSDGLVGICRIRLLALRQLIFPFHTFW